MLYYNLCYLKDVLLLKILVTLVLSRGYECIKVGLSL